MTDDDSLAVEWALWGKAETDVEYNLLVCSRGLERDVFVEQINSHSPGTAESWPQATVNGFSGPAGERWTGLAVCDTAQGRYDASGREIVFTRYFCAPFHALAQARIGYGQLYDGCSAFWPTSRRTPHYLDTITERATPPELRPALAARVAALLLTGRPVCVLGAHDTDARSRLAFLDLVMSFLPFGMRAWFAGATWASSTAYDLNFRLFFADLRRAANDHVVDWNGTTDDRIGYRHSDQYMDWLRESPDAVDVLARLTEPTGFGKYEVADLLERLGTSHAPVVAAPPSGRAAPPLPLPLPSPGGDVAGLLRECGRHIRGANPNFMETELAQLRARRSVVADRLSWQDIVAKQGLLLPQPQLKKQQVDDLYRTVLRLVFGVPLSYEAYLAVAECAGGEPLHKKLAAALDPDWLCDERVRLLVARAFGDRELKKVAGELRRSPAGLAAIVVATDLDPSHATWLIESALAALRDCPDASALQQALLPHGYLAPALNRSFPGQVKAQAGWLQSILERLYGDPMDPRVAAMVLDLPPHMTTPALLAAVLGLTDMADAPVAAQAYARNTLRHAGLDRASTDALLALFPATDASAATDASDASVPGSGTASPAGRPAKESRLRDAAKRLHLTPEKRHNSPE